MKPTDPPAPVYWPKTIVILATADSIRLATVESAEWYGETVPGGWRYRLTGFVPTYREDQLRADFTSALILHGQLRERAGLT